MAIRPQGRGWGIQAWAVFDSLTTRTGTYSRSGTTVTLSRVAHGLTAGMFISLSFTATSGTAPAAGYYEIVSTPTADTFTITASSGSGTGNFSSNLLIKDSFNIASASKVSIGTYSFSFSTPFASKEFGASGMLYRASATGFLVFNTPPTTGSSATISSLSFSGVGIDSEHSSVNFYGKQ